MPLNEPNKSPAEQNPKSEFNILSADQDLQKHIKDQSNIGVQLSEKEVKKMIDEAKAEVLTKANKELSDQTQIDKISLITIFGIFASFFTFLSIEVPMLRNSDDSLGVKIGFSLVLCALILCFPMGLDYLVTSRINSIQGRQMPGEIWRVVGYVLLLIALFGSGFWAMWYFSNMP